MTVKISKDLITPSIDKIQQQLSVLPQQAFKTWVDNTPVRSGNARRKTRLQGNEIVTNYGYAVPLDQGSSRQAPQGMSRPTEQFVSQQLKKIMRK